MNENNRNDTRSLIQQFQSYIDLKEAPQPQPKITNNNPSDEKQKPWKPKKTVKFSKVSLQTSLHLDEENNLVGGRIYKVKTKKESETQFYKLLETCQSEIEGFFSKINKMKDIKALVTNFQALLPSFKSLYSNPRLESNLENFRFKQVDANITQSVGYVLKYIREEVGSSSSFEDIKWLINHYAKMEACLIKCCGEEAIKLFFVSPVLEALSTKYQGSLLSQNQCAQLYELLGHEFIRQEEDNNEEGFVQNMNSFTLR